MTTNGATFCSTPQLYFIDWSFQWSFPMDDVMVLLWWGYCVSFHLFDNKFLLDYHKFSVYFSAQHYAQRAHTAIRPIVSGFSASRGRQSTSAMFLMGRFTEKRKKPSACVVDAVCGRDYLLFLINKFSFVERNLWEHISYPYTNTRPIY